MRNRRVPFGGGGSSSSSTLKWDPKYNAVLGFVVVALLFLGGTAYMAADVFVHRKQVVGNAEPDSHARSNNEHLNPSEQQEKESSDYYQSQIISNKKNTNGDTIINQQRKELLTKKKMNEDSNQKKMDPAFFDIDGEFEYYVDDMGSEMTSPNSDGAVILKVNTRDLGVRFDDEHTGLYGSKNTPDSSRRTEDDQQNRVFLDKTQQQSRINKFKKGESLSGMKDRSSLKHQFGLPRNQTFFKWENSDWKRSKFSGAMNYEVKAILTKTITLIVKSSLKPKYLEWGSGGSTLLVNTLIGANGKMASVEHVSQWCDKMTDKESLQTGMISGKLSYICLKHSIPVGMYGYVQAKPEVKRILGQSYANDAFDLAMRRFGLDPSEPWRESSKEKILNKQEWQDQTLDVVLVDGRFRAACAMKLLLSDRIRCLSDSDQTQLPPTVIFIHDFWNRINAYKLLFEWYESVGKEDVLVVLHCKRSIHELSSIEKERAMQQFDHFLSQDV